MPKDAIRIAFCAEANYIPHAAAMLSSLLASNEDESFELYLVEGPDLNLDDSAKLETWLKDKGQSLNRVRVAIDELLGRDFQSPFFHRSIWYRVLLPELLPAIQKVLYLDADTLVVDRLRPLWETDLRGYLFAAVVNPLYPNMPNWPVENLGLPARHRYLNSGVLLLDLESMRREGCARSVQHYASSSPEYHGHPVTEQDSLAALYHERCLFLHPRWNVQTTFYELGMPDIPAERHEVREARRNPAIVHFSGPWKPSQYVCRHPYRSAYLHYRANTPWPLAEPTGKSLRNLVLRALPIQWMWRIAGVRNRVLRLFRPQPALQ